MKKCDVIIPVYKSPDWVKICVYALFKNTDNKFLNKVYLINDCDDELTENCLNNLAKKYDKIQILKNVKNLGFVKTCNRGMKISNAEYVLLLNTDCIISKGTIEKLIGHMERNNKVGLICPISSNAANLTLDMFEGFSYADMNRLLEDKFSGMVFDACTVVGNCLMISKECINQTGFLDEAYGTGYGEETDYQFKAMEKGFEAKVAIDTYVFHKSEVSFGKSKEKIERQKKNAELFFSRWKSQYDALMKEYKKNDPIEYILKHITDDDKKISFDFLIYLIGFSQNAGGVHMTVDMVNYLVINGTRCNIFYNFSNGYDEILLFNPIQTKNIDNYKFKKIVSTIYYSTYYARKIADERKIPLIYFAQGYEPYFENGNCYGTAELSYKLPDKILTISDYLKQRYIDMFNAKSDVISNAVNYDLIHKKNDNKSIKTITIMLRDNPLKGDFILLDIVKKLSMLDYHIDINILYNQKFIEFPFIESKRTKVNFIKGPFKRLAIYELLQKSDLYIDASLTEGFGLMALEAMTAGNVVIVSNSGGINEYITDGKNGIIINDVNNVYSYILKIEELINNNEKYQLLKNNTEKSIKNFDYDDRISSYNKYFAKKVDIKDINLTNEELKLMSDVFDQKFKISILNNKKNLLYKICKRMPKGIRVGTKKIIQKLYDFTNVR